jgi:hypothetical protein
MQQDLMVQRVKCNENFEQLYLAPRPEADRQDAETAVSAEQIVFDTLLSRRHCRKQFFVRLGDASSSSKVRSRTHHKTCFLHNQHVFKCRP